MSSKFARWLAVPYFQSVKRTCLTLFVKVLVKCRQNVANKLFISRYFNPVVPYILICLTALTAKCSTERSHKVQRRSRQAVSLCGGTESTYNTVVVDVGPFGSVGCVARVPSLIAQSGRQLIN